MAFAYRPLRTAYDLCGRIVARELAILGANYVDITDIRC